MEVTCIRIEFRPRLQFLEKGFFRYETTVGGFDFTASDGYFVLIVSGVRRNIDSILPFTIKGNIILSVILGFGEEKDNCDEIHARNNGAKLASALEN